MQERTLAEELSEFIVDTTYEKLPKEVVHKTKRFFMNHVGCVLGAKGNESSDIVVKAVSTLGGEKQSTILGYGIKTSCLNAALANGIIGYALEMNDDHKVAVAHPVVATAPAALAVAERDHINGRQLIVAEALGTEVLIRIGKAFLGLAHDAGFHITGNCGVFGSATAAGKLLGLNKAKMVNALGIAGGTASGQARLNVKSGSMTKRYQGGHGAMGGLLSALLAKEGFTGPASVLEGAGGAPGFVQARSCKNKFDLSMINNSLGKKWEMLDTAVKFNACCSYLAPVVDCCLEIANKHDLKAAEIQEVNVRVCNQFLTALGTPKEDKYQPKTVVHAQFSIPYGVGVAFCRRRAFHTEFTSESIKDQKILEVASKVKMEWDDEAEKRFPTDYVAKVEVKTKEGRTFKAETYHAKGTVENPLSDEELMAKFRNLTEPILDSGKAEKVMEMIWNLDEVQNIGKLIDYIHGR